MSNPFNFNEVDIWLDRLTVNDKAISELKEESCKLFSNILTNCCKLIFEEYDKLIDSIIWTQYTPYWNDGDTTEFGVNDLWVNFKDTPINREYIKLKFEQEFDQLDEYERGCRLFKDRITDLFNKLNFIDDFKNNRTDECLKMFGDHIKVIINAEGIHTEDYHHD